MMLINILLITLLTRAPSQQFAVITPPTCGLVAQDARPTPSPCAQPVEERGRLIRQAVENQYWVRRVEFIGNERTRDYVLRRKVLLQEGDVFTRANLAGSLASVSKLKRITYPVKLGDVIIRLDEAEKIIDLAICFRERPRAR